MKFPKKSLIISMVACMGSFLISCDEDVTATLTTYSVYDVTNTSASVSGSISIVGDDIEESGFLLTTNSTIVMKTTNCVRHVSTGSLLDVKVTFGSLSVDSIYRLRMYAISDDSIYYGSTYSFIPGSVVIPTELVEGGVFPMGGTAEQAAYAKENEFPVHSISVSAFRMGSTEVTNAQYLTFLKSRRITNGGSTLTGGGVTKILIYPNLHGLQYKTESASWVIAPGFENHPVVRVTWYGANEFCRWAGGRLPTEAEWEWAARGGNASAGVSTLFSGGNLEDSTAVAWFNSNTKSLPVGSNDAQPVGTKTKNSLNLYDMSGNVWEWVSDWYLPYLSTPQSDPMGMSDADALESGITDKVRRGGGWADPDVNALRVSRRDHNVPDANMGSCGFRFVKDL